MISLYVTIAIIVVLLTMSAFFSGSETALTAASRPLMHQLAQNGDPRAAVVNGLHARTDRLIGTLLLGNNLVNILASSLATSVLITAFGEAGIAYATILMTTMVLIFAEIMPKTYAFRNPNGVALTVGRPVALLVAVLSPLTQATEAIVRLALRPVGGAQEGIGPSIEELRGAIDLHTADEPEIRHERAMLRSILDLAEVQVGEIMIHRKNVVTIDADQPIDDLVTQVLASPYTRIPLWRDVPDNIIGVIHAKALLRAVRESEGRTDGLDVVSMAAEPWFVPESTTLLDQLQAFRRRREHFAIVVDEYGSLMGVVTLEDILEEIVGDIDDETDVAVAGVVRQPDGSFVVQGTVTIRDLNRKFEWRLPDEEAATIAGLVLHEAKRIPEVGQAFMFHGFRFEILRRHRQQIAAIRVTPPPGSEPVVDG
ncbi:MAG: HlyC/CorC family transporter [Rhodospirillales bacterium]|nr:HlyC/CorC family transporter [Rhodospirillales bacterium]